MVIVNFQSNVSFQEQWRLPPWGRDGRAVKELIHDVVDRLFKDAGVEMEKIS